ncbi:hypothetical protein [Modestobacter sp. SSW1-42]|uniref:hypothetical protein n=1 Tax=Modestobacter sp. SSW1-42 TaxID=596372 RepID=UPI003986F067
MTKTPVTGQRTRRPLRAAALAVLTALLAVVAPLLTPASASATGYYGYDGGYNGGYSGGGYSGPVVVFPVLNCIQSGSNGAFTAVLGYRNTSTSTYSITGDYNVFSPSSYNGRQPTTFKPGTYNGVFSLPVSSGTVYWTLGSTKLTISRTAAAACPKDTQMPADGNGTGVVGALAVAAGLGALVVHRARRRAGATPVKETVDA